MRRIAALAAIALLPLALAGQAQAANKEYVQLNEKGLKQILLKKSWAPGWLGKLNSYEAAVSLKGDKPIECATTDVMITGNKSANLAQMLMDFDQGGDGHLLDIHQNVYQYADVASAQAGWKVLMDAAGACAGTHVHDIKDASGKVIGKGTSVVTVTVKPGMYGQQQLIINEDVQLVEPLPGGIDTANSADEVSVWMYDGAAIVEIESNKYVPKFKGWVFSAPQAATIETLALVAIQRYHLYALKAI